jgi:hypothetical protein
MVSGREIVFMPSCTVPTFSKMLITSKATQPDMETIWVESSSAVVKVPASTRFRLKSHTATAPVATRKTALRIMSPAT